MRDTGAAEQLPVVTLVVTYKSVLSFGKTARVQSFGSKSLQLCAQDGREFDKLFWSIEAEA